MNCSTCNIPAAPHKLIAACATDARRQRTRKGSSRLNVSAKRFTNATPRLPPPSQRLRCLQRARAAGLNVFVAVAPTYPESDDADMVRTLEAIRQFNPVTVFMEPVNIRAENVERIAAHANAIGEKVNTSVFATPTDWRRYAMTAFSDMELAAVKTGLDDRLHLWPDASLGSGVAVADIVKHGEQFGVTAEGHRRWLEQRWNRVSEWPA